MRGGAHQCSELIVGELVHDLDRVAVGLAVQVGEFLEGLAHALGRTAIAVEVIAMTDEQGRTINPFVQSRRLAILRTAPPPIGEAPNPPGDLDGDGLFEDVNGDGQLTLADVILFALNLRSLEVLEHAQFFDFNNDGDLDFDDVRALSERVRN